MSNSDEDVDGKSEELRRLLDDEDFQKASEAGHSLKEIIDSCINKVNGAVKELTDLKKAVEKSYDDSRKARIAGTTATVTGSVIAITGFGLSFVTLGASLVLTVAGAVLAAAGGATIGGAEIGYLVVSRKKLKETENACDESNKAMDDLKDSSEEFSKYLQLLSNKHPTFTEENIFHLLRQAWNFSEPTFKTFYSGYKLIDGVTDIGRNALAVTNTVRTVRAGVQAGARTVYAGLGTFGRVFSIGGVVLDVVFIPIDIAVLVKSAYDVHKYSENGKSNSAAASNIDSIIKQLEENKENLEEVRNQLPGA